MAARIIPPPPQGPPPPPGTAGVFEQGPGLPGPPGPPGPLRQNNIGGGGGAGNIHDARQGGGKESQQVFPPTFQGWTLRKAEPEPGQPYDWTRVNITEFPVSTRDMAARAKQSRRKHSVLEVYDALRTDSQRSQIDRLIEDQNRQEQNVWAEWKLANIEVIRRAIPGVFGSTKVIETTQLRVILKKVPRETPKKAQKKLPKSNSFAGDVVDLFEPPPPAPVAGKKEGGGVLGAAAGGLAGGGVERLPPPPHGFPPPGVHVMGNDFDRRDESRGRRGRRQSPGPRTSAEKLNKVLNYLERLGIPDSENDSDDIIDEVDGGRGRRRIKYRIPPPPIGRNSRRRPKSPFVNNRRDSGSSIDMIDYAESSSSGQYTDATPPLSAANGRYTRRYLDRSRSRSPGRFRVHGKPPAYPLPGEPTINYNFFGDAAKDPLYVRRHSDGERPFVSRYPTAALPAAPDAPLYGYNGVAARAQNYMDATSRRGTYPVDDMRRELDAFQKGREEERRANLEARVQELRRQEEASMRRIDDLKRVEDGVRWGRRDSERDISPRDRTYSGGYTRR